MKKIFLILTALVMSVAVFAQKITTLGGITSGNKYYIGATTGGKDYYFYVDGSSKTESIKSVAKEDVADAVALTFTAVTDGWTIQFENGLYLGLKNAKDNGAVQVMESPVVWTIDEDVNNGLLKLHPNDYYLQKNNSGTQFGSYNNQQTNVWLESAGGATPVSAILESIVIKGAATKMAYEVGEAFDPAGLEVWGLYTKYVKNDSTSQITSGITWSINPETFTTVSGNASVTLSASYKDKTSEDKTITGIKVSAPAPIDYLCFTAGEGGATIALTKVGTPTEANIKYQIGSTSGGGWETVVFKTSELSTFTSIKLTAGQKVFFYNDGVTGFSKGNNDYYRFEMTGSIAASGNVMSLVDKNCENQNAITEIPCDYCFCNLFMDCKTLTSAPVLPATTLAANCYKDMFKDCTALTMAPELPATTMKDSCYYYMFRNCTALKTAPKLPATTLAIKCYSFMFNGCTALTTAPELLPATTLTKECYSNMFYGCSALTTAPKLPATTLTNTCYGNMFNGCSALTTAPELPATTLEQSCYGNMFNGCSALTTAPELPATKLTAACYNNMFKGCSALTTAPELPATKLEMGCYNNMFNGCEKLNDIKVAFTDWDVTGATTKWVTSVPTTGTLTFTCPKDLGTTTPGENKNPAAFNIKNTYDLTVSGAWASMCVNLPLIVPTGAKVYYASAVHGNTIELTQIEAGTVMAAKTAVIVKGAGTVSFPIAGEAGTSFTNLFQGSSVAKACNPGENYVLNAAKSSDTNVHFSIYTGTTLSDHKAYLPMSAVSGASSIQFRFGDATAISTVETEVAEDVIYNLAGQRVGSDYRGLVIKNGKKILKR